MRCSFNKLDINHISTLPFIVQLSVYIVCFNFYCMLCIIFLLFYRGPQDRLAFIAYCATLFKYCLDKNQHFIEASIF